MKRAFSLFIACIVFLGSCTHELRCARYIIPANFIGKMTIYFNKKNGQKEFNKEGCVVYRISDKGECYSALPLEQGLAYPNKTFKFFEVFKQDSMREIPEFDKYEYLRDSLNNRERKYVFFGASGYINPTGSNPNDVLEYYVDFGKNYRNY